MTPIANLLSRAMSGDAIRQATAANEPPPLRHFLVRIKYGSEVRHMFSVMDVDALAAAARHECLTEPGEYVSVMPAERYYAERKQS